MRYRLAKKMVGRMSVTLSTGSGTVKSPLSIRKDDLYETPPCAVRALLAVEDLPAVIWEPACGPGSIVRVLREFGKLVHASDLVDYGCDDSTARRDFLMEQVVPSGTEAIVTNPPFKLAAEFAVHALALCPQVCLLLRLAFLEGLRWERGLADGLCRVHVFAPRLPFMHRHDFAGKKNSNNAMPFAWFCWQRGYNGAPAIDWINWRKLDGEE